MCEEWTRARQEWKQWWVRPTFWNQISWIQNPVLPPTNYVTVGELLNLSRPKFYPLQKANENGTHFTELL